MKKSYLLLILVAACLLATPFGTATAAVNVSDIAGIQTGINGIQVPFIENRGQVHKEVAFYAQTFGGTFFVTTDGVMVLSIPTPEKNLKNSVISEKLVGATKSKAKGWERAETVVNLYSGADPEKWFTELPTFHSLTFNDVYEGVGLDLKAYANNVEKIFRVRPGADPSAIRVQTEGALDLSIDKSGNLILRTEHGNISFSRPVAYQEVEGKRQAVEVAYAVDGSSYGFLLGKYDRNSLLVIDPLIRSTYLGGRGDDSIQAVQIHGTTGKVYVCGQTKSYGFGPTYLSESDSDVFVARLNSPLTDLERVTFLRGSANDVCKDIQLGSTVDRVYLMGYTNSDDFPVLDPAQGTFGGGTDAFAAHLNTDLTLGSVTYLGGSGADNPVDMAIDGTSNDLYIVGDTDSADFPTTTGAPQGSLSGTIALRDGFVVRYDSDLTVQLSTYLGGSHYDNPTAVSVHPSTGDLYVAGETRSDDIPQSSGGAQPSNNGLYDAFVARYNSSLTTHMQTTYLGGASGGETYVDMDIHPFTGEVFLTGLTNSVDFPAFNAVQGTFGGLHTDLFAAVINASLTTIETATYLGGNGTEEVFPGNLALTSGDVYIAGYSSAPDFADTDFASGGVFIASFPATLGTIYRNVYLGGYNGSGLLMHPANGDLYLAGDAGPGLAGTTGGAQATFGGGTYDAFVMRLSPDLTVIRQATYLGGQDNDSTGNPYNPRLAIHPLSDEIYVVGNTGPVGLASYVGDFPGTAGGAQSSYGGSVSTDGFVAYFDTTLTATPGGCTDNDGDTFYKEGGSCGTADCDDNEPDTYPGNSEICDGAVPPSQSFSAPSQISLLPG